MDTFELVSQVGLTKKEAAVYAALVEGGAMTLTELNKETHINRPALYELLPAMKQKEYVTSTKKGKRTYYHAESPAKLLARYEANHYDLKERFLELTKQYEANQHDRPVIKYFEGQKGMRFVFDDIAHTLPRGGQFYRYTSYTGDATPYKNSYYAKVRETKGIERLVITSEAKAKQKPKKLERSVKAIPRDFDLFEDNVSLVIYGDKTAYVDYDSNTSFIVESEKIARFQEKLFKLLWKKLD